VDEYWNDNWHHLFAENKLSTFDDIWNLDTEWFEEPNQRRGGWSGVIKVELDTNEGKTGVFIKRQENHISKTWLHPIKGILTFEREFKNILQMQNRDLPVMETVFFAQRSIDNKRQAILITKELTGYLPLDSEQFLSSGDLIKNAPHKKQLLIAVADAVRSIHKYHFEHNCLYLKHIFVKPVGDSWDVKIIDLEKLKWRIFKRKAVFRDLYTLYRHARGWSSKDHVRLFKLYNQEHKLSSKSKKLWREIEARILSKIR